MPYSKEERIAYQREYYLKNKEKCSLKAKKWREKHNEKLRNIKKYSDLPMSMLIQRINICRARTKDISLTAEELLELIPKDLRCPVFGTKFVFGTHRNWSDKQKGMSVDRIDNNKGYHKDNIVIVSFKANTMKSSATLKELYQVADFYYELEKKSNA